VSSYKYLGVIMNDKNDFGIHCNALAKGAGRALGSIINKLKLLRQYGFKTFEKLYSSCVIPVLDYCAGVWGYRHYQPADNVQNRAMRQYLGVHRFAPTLALIGDTGWLPCMYRRWMCMIRYWNRLILLPDDRLTKRVFIADYNSNGNNWCSDIKQILTKLDLMEFFDNKSVIYLSEAHSKLNNYYSRLWSSDVQRVSKLRTYITFKSVFSCEDYLKLNLKRNELSLLAQLRFGILPLRIETGRYIGEAPEQRLCSLCDLMDIESEVHFIIVCPRYRNIRTQYIGHILNTMQTISDNEKLCVLMKNYTRQTVKYISAAYLKRKDILYN
jgi:hypothetical protein